MPETRTLTLKDFLTTQEIRTAIRLWKTKQSTQQFHREMMEMLKPIMPRINERLGQENDIGYLSYAVEYVMMEHDEKG